jgi:acetate kinase
MANVLTINAGSSSIRFALFSIEQQPRRLLDGKIERIGTAQASLTASRTGQTAQPQHIEAADAGGATEALLRWLGAQESFAKPDAIGHRVVHGMLRTEPERVTPALLADLKAIAPFDPEHLPREIELIDALQHRYANVPQVVCFDTAFHRTMPEVAVRLPIPRRYAARGVQRYGFHGLSYTFLMQELARLSDPAAKHGRVILAHLGNGASLAAILDGRCIDTSMGFTPSSGLVMGTRSGDLDPGLVSYLALTDGMTAAQFQRMVNHESGLIGISESSADVRDLLNRESEDARARDALALFCYQAKKWIGSFAAALGGVDTLVFAGGIGENAPLIRLRICENLQFLGIHLDESLNLGNAARVSANNSRVTVRVIRTDEESVIAQQCAWVLGLIN